MWIDTLDGKGAHEGLEFERSKSGMLVRPIVIKNTSSNRRLQIFLFGILAYLLPLGCIRLMNNTALGEIDIVHFILFGIEAASPTIAAVIIVSFFEKKAGIKTFFCSNFSPKLKISAH